MNETRGPRSPRGLRGARRSVRYLIRRRPVGAGTVDPSEYEFLRRAAELAFEAERSGNVPIGAVIVLGGRVIAEGQNSVYRPLRHPGRHAETEALRAVPDEMWVHAREMTCYSTLEPCLMCLSTLYFHGVQRIVFVATAPMGGAGIMIEDWPWYMHTIQWIGPLRDEESRDLRRRVRRSLLRNA